MTYYQTISFILNLHHQLLSSIIGSFVFLFCLNTFKKWDRLKFWPFHEEVSLCCPKLKFKLNQCFAVQVKTADMMSEMIEAARSGNRKCLRKMILRGCSLHCRDSRGWTPLHEAAAAGHAQCVQEILSAVCEKHYTFMHLLLSNVRLLTTFNHYETTLIW